MTDKKLRLGFPGGEKTFDAKYDEGTPEPWDLNTDLKVVGHAHPRIDGKDKVTGKAKYSFDIRLPGLIYARFLRSPHGSAVVKKVDLSKAKAMKGVLFTEAYEGTTVRYAGQQVAGVAAETEEILDDALAAIEVDYEVKPSAPTTDAAMKKRAPLVAGGDSNVRPGRPPRANQVQQVQKAHQEADIVLEKEYRTQVQTHSCLETHGCTCKWDDDGTKLTVWASTQGTFAFKGTMARAMRVPAQNVDVITEHMGGGFGSKFGADAWDVFTAKAARETKRPCKYLLDRSEEHLVAGMRPDSIQKCKFSVKNDGTLMGAEVHAWGTAGTSGRGAGVMNPGIYRFRASLSEQSGVLTHSGRARAFRAPRHPQGIFALEGMIDELAEAVGIDPLELRKKNDPHPVRQAQYEVGAKAIGWNNRKKSGSGKGPLKRGFGMASARWSHNARGGSAVDCRIEKDGSVLIANGAQDLGTGTRTILAGLAAEELGLQPTDLSVRLGHTTDPVGPPSGGSQTAPSIAPSARHAAWLAKKELLGHVAKAVGGDAAKMDLKEGRVVGAPRELSFKQACSLMPVDAVETRGQGLPGFYRFPRFARDVAGVQFAEVEVDTETGRVRVLKVVAVQDCGLVINPLLARSQINGGVIQGISYALFEDRLLDAETGNMVNPNFLDYKIAGPLEIPEIVSIPFTVAQGLSITGVSSLGEPPTVPTAGAIGNAVANAIGTRVRSLPITPDKVLAALGAV